MTGKELRALRKSKKITRKRLAELTGYSTRGLLKIEANEEKKIPTKLLILIQALNNNV